MDELRDRVAKAEARLEALKENFHSFAAEVKGEYRQVIQRLDEADRKIMKLIIVTTLLAQGAGQVLGPVIKSVLGA